MKLLQLLSIREQDDVLDADDLDADDLDADDHDDDHDDGSYEREKKVSLLILRAFRKCGLQVSEHRDKHSGTRDHDDYWGHDVLYIEDDREATVTLDEAELSDLVKLQGSGLFDGKCTIAATSDGSLRLTFQVHPAIAKGDASIAEQIWDQIKISKT